LFLDPSLSCKTAETTTTPSTLGQSFGRLRDCLRDLFGDLQLSDVRRPNLDIVFNACELRTATAFRFGNRRSGTWRFGEIADNKVSVAHAIACSAAYPMFLPAFDRKYSFLKSGKTQPQRVIITDGGAFDNLGTSCLEPGRNDAFSLHVYPADYSFVVMPVTDNSADSQYHSASNRE